MTVLQRQVDELDEMKAQHYQEIMEHEEEVWDVVQAKVCLSLILLNIRLSPTAPDMLDSPLHNGCLRQVHSQSVSLISCMLLSNSF